LSNIGVHDFAIPHDCAEPLRDIVLIRMPRPPEKVGSIIVPGMTRDIAQHNTMAGRIVSMGPLAFHFKDANEDGSPRLSTKKVNVGDWVLIRPYAGTLVQGGQIMATSGWRYVSSFQDVLAVIPADKMPDPATLLWDEDQSQQKVEGGAVDLAAEKAKNVHTAFSFDNKR
jgi:co-chaperonin GroES (HSP10)